MGRDGTGRTDDGRRTDAVRTDRRECRNSYVDCAFGFEGLVESDILFKGCLLGVPRELILLPKSDQ